MLLDHYTPHLLAGASLFLAIFLHWRCPNAFWKPSLQSAGITAVLAMLVIFVLHENYLNLETASSDWIDLGKAVGLVVFSGFAYGLIVAILVGYVVKLAPSFFD
jgi:hypothetical protein